MDKIFEKTRELGQALIESEPFQAMKAAEDKAFSNPEAADAMGKYLELRNEVQQMLATENPDPVAMKNLSDDMDAQQEKLNMLEDIVALTQARNEFSNLIAQVNQVLQFIVTGKIDDADESGCSGGCASCGGCHHVN